MTTRRTHVLVAGDGSPALLVPALPFDEHPDAIVEALRERRTRSLRR